MLKGLSHGVTDMTAFHGFKNLAHLKVLGIFGDTQISNVGRKFVKNLYPEAIVYIS